jgi:hypothetical protein
VIFFHAPELLLCAICRAACSTLSTRRPASAARPRQTPHHTTSQLHCFHHYLPVYIARVNPYRMRHLFQPKKSDIVACVMQLMGKQYRDGSRALFGGAVASGQRPATRNPSEAQDQQPTSCARITFPTREAQICHEELPNLTEQEPLTIGSRCSCFPLLRSLSKLSKAVHPAHRRRRHCR